MQLYTNFDYPINVGGRPLYALSAFAVVALWDMRLALPALLAHYLVAGLLFVDILDPRLAFVYVLTGLFVTAMSSVPMRQVLHGW